MKTQIQILLTLQSVIMLSYLLLVYVLQLGDVISALSGCLISLLPGIYVSIQMLRQENNNNATEWLGYAYRSEIGKWVMAGLLFILAFTSGYQWDPIIFFVGYLLVQISGMFIPLIKKGN